MNNQTQINNEENILLNIRSGNSNFQANYIPEQNSPNDQNAGFLDYVAGAAISGIAYVGLIPVDAATGLVNTPLEKISNIPEGFWERKVEQPFLNFKTGLAATTSMAGLNYAKKLSDKFGTKFLDKSINRLTGIAGRALASRVAIGSHLDYGTNMIKDLQEFDFKAMIGHSYEEAVETTLMRQVYDRGWRLFGLEKVENGVISGAQWVSNNTAGRFEWSKGIAEKFNEIVDIRDHEAILERANSKFTKAEEAFNKAKAAHDANPSEKTKTAFEKAEKAFKSATDKFEEIKTKFGKSAGAANEASSTAGATDDATKAASNTTQTTQQSQTTQTTQQAEPTNKAETKHNEPAKTEPAKTKPVKSEPLKTEAKTIAPKLQKQITNAEKSLEKAKALYEQKPTANNLKELKTKVKNLTGLLEKSGKTADEIADITNANKTFVESVKAGVAEGKGAASTLGATDDAVNAAGNAAKSEGGIARALNGAKSFAGKVLNPIINNPVSRFAVNNPVSKFVGNVMSKSAGGLAFAGAAWEATSNTMDAIDLNAKLDNKNLTAAQAKEIKSQKDEKVTKAVVYTGATLALGATAFTALAGGATLLATGAALASNPVGWGIAAYMVADLATGYLTEKFLGKKTTISSFIGDAARSGWEAVKEGWNTSMFSVMSSKLFGSDKEKSTGESINANQKAPEQSKKIIHASDVSKYHYKESSDIEKLQEAINMKIAEYNKGKPEAQKLSEISEDGKFGRGTVLAMHRLGMGDEAIRIMGINRAGYNKMISFAEKAEKSQDPQNDKQVQLTNAMFKEINERKQFGKAFGDNNIKEAIDKLTPAKAITASVKKESPKPLHIDNRSEKQKEAEFVELNTLKIPEIIQSNIEENQHNGTFKPSLAKEDSKLPPHLTNANKDYKKSQTTTNLV